MKTIYGLQCVSIILIAAATGTAQDDPVFTEDARSTRVEIHDLRAFTPQKPAKPVEPTEETPAPFAPVAPPSTPPKDHLARFISAFVQPPLQGVEELRMLQEGYLVANLRPAQHTWLRAFLDQARKQTKRPIELQTTFSIVPEATFRTKIAPFTADPESGERSSFLLAEDVASKAWLRDLHQGEAVESLIAPKAAFLPLQKLEIATIEQVSYVRDFDVGKTNAPPTPVIDVVKHGIVTEATAMVTKSGAVAVRYSFSKMTLIQPIPTFETTLKGHKVEVQLPEVRLDTYDQEALVPAHNTLVTCLPSTRDDKSWIIVTLAARVLPKQGAK